MATKEATRPRYTEAQKRKVLDAVDRGMSQQRASKRFKVSVGSIQNWRKAAGSGTKRRRLGRRKPNATRKAIAGNVVSKLMWGSGILSELEDGGVELSLERLKVCKLDNREGKKLVVAEVDRYLELKVK